MLDVLKSLMVGLILLAVCMAAYSTMPHGRVSADNLAIKPGHDLPWLGNLWLEFSDQTVVADYCLYREVEVSFPVSNEKIYLVGWPFNGGKYYLNNLYK